MDDPSSIAAHLAIARPRVLAALVRRFRDLDRAEDALQEACVRALETWAAVGTPRDPAAWLIRTGHNAAIDAFRRTSKINDQVDPDKLDLDDGHDEERSARDLDGAHYKDDVLRLMFMCCQPELPLQDQLALALKVLGGLTVSEIARAFLVPSKTMGQRMTRAKKKAEAMAVHLRTPTPQERLERLNAVTLMLYLMFNEGYSATSGIHHIRPALCDEAVRLIRLLVSLFPGQSEVRGLLALCLLQHSRRTARIDEDDTLVPLEAQDRSLWDQRLILEGRTLLEQALRSGRPGPYQIQAAIAATHCGTQRPEDTDWAEIERLYRALEAVQPTPIVTLNRAVAVSKVRGPEKALGLLAPIEETLASYLPFQATRAALLNAVGDNDAARLAYRAALDLDMTEQERAFLVQQMEQSRENLA